MNNIVFKKGVWCVEDASVGKGVCRSLIKMEGQNHPVKVVLRPPHPHCGTHTHLQYLCTNITCTQIQTIIIHFKNKKRV